MKLKLILQIIFSGLVVVYIYYSSEQIIDLSLTLPYLKDFALFMGVFFIPWSIFVIVGSSNAVNLTDGLDGLAILPCILIAAAFVVFAYVQGNFNIANSIYFINCNIFPKELVSSVSECERFSRVIKRYNF